jgi:hypothetical protein
LDYRPRPTIQEYTTYSAALIDRNRQFFFGERAPKYLLFAPGSIDHRHPASAEGPLWPLMFSLYEPNDQVRNMIILRRRETPIGNLFGPAELKDAGWGSPIAVPPHIDPLFLSVDIKTTLIGRLLDVLYKPPFVWMVVNYQDGSQTRYRLIPEQARAGFVVSPLVTTAIDSLHLIAGRMDVAGWKRPVEFRVEADFPGALAYGREISISLAPMRADLLRAGVKDNTFVQEQIKSLGSP